jgi:hypothetical protein
MDLQEGMVIKSILYIHLHTPNIYIRPCKCIWQIFTLASCKCKWFTPTHDLHVVYMTIDTYNGCNMWS